MDSADFTIILATLITSAFFSGMEIAFISANKLRIELHNKQGVWSAKILSWYLKDPSKFISTTLVGNNIALVVYGIITGKVMNTFLTEVIHHDFWRFVVITIVSTLIVLVTAEFIPKALFRINPDFILNALILPFHICYFLLWPIINFVLAISKWFIKIITGEEVVKTAPAFTKVDLDHFISQTGQIELDEDKNLSTEMFKNALDFGTLRVRDCMVPRTELVAIEESDPIDELYSQFLDSRHSKILVYRNNVDHIIGYVHQVSMFKKPQSIKEVLMPILITNESRMLNDQLKEMTLKRKSIAVVVDEFGGTAGVISTEDIIEEIFGEIDDEYDTEELKETRINDSRYIFSARHTIDYLNETYNLKIPDSEYDTLGGYIISICESIPSEKEVILTDRFEFVIKQVKHARIEEVELKILSGTEIDH
ncbi:MAG: HlyC/CorC family transporter [Bacteroidia bacterium]|nr:HlyC/CorC family transporter [Bacteroidia bacterium]